MCSVHPWCMYECATHKHLWICLWKPKADIRCLSTLHSEVESLSPELAISASLASQLVPWIPCLYHQGTGITVGHQAHHLSYLGGRDLNSGPQACTKSTLPQPWEEWTVVPCSCNVNDTGTLCCACGKWTPGVERPLLSPPKPRSGSSWLCSGQRASSSGNWSPCLWEQVKVTNPNRVIDIPFYKRACSVGVRGQKLSGELQQNAPTFPWFLLGVCVNSDLMMLHLFVFSSRLLGSLCWPL